MIYPLLVEGKPVYEEYGQPKGMTINVDVKTGRVSDVYGMDKLNFESSDYEVQTDFPKILEVAKNGGRGMYNFPEMGSGDEKIVKVALGEPEMIYTHRYDYQNGISNEYLVPSLLFPVLQEPKEGEYFSKTVIVPVIKEFFDMKPQMPMMYKNEMAR